ncbi:16S rRNA (cytosine(967)-C(5))-methyltransferase RsmB [Microbulbifer sp. YPW1]|uniref:16S rRNA (cytosine(967)-C(5))-methyltransferase RsmB n=1 Tax=Microbulbifer sp. YPW1 TaxID=2745199 RepID=UPI001599CD09|nr:16S rRNA (cytosine(967)-C(5))-methyltransferase RsmB [Microbulbifer sp. YPW1]QKX16654.1 16S rRNA (cytosine(967)-C(5))-methyltransferase RsmB [Microbulbifer sp. YPW1]
MSDSSSKTLKDARALAARVIARLYQDRGSLQRLLPWAEKQVDEKDRALLRELCYGTARFAPRLELMLKKLLRKPVKDEELEALMLVGLYQLEYTRIPDHAAIAATVEAARAIKLGHATGVVNGVLRNALRNKETLTRKLSGNPQFSSAHPEWLQQAVKNAWGSEARTIFTANNENPPMTLRVNAAQTTRDDYLEQLKQAGIPAQPCELADSGLVLETPVAVTRLPGFEEGLVSVQDQSAQLAAQLLDPQAGEKILDACAAPGGKTCHLMELQPDLDLSALDIEEERLDRVIENMERLGIAVQIICADAAEPEHWWDGEQYDRILLDAPCSATGVIRRNPDIKLLRRPEDIAELAELQGRILRAMWPLLKPGGTLLYATCSILPEENSAQVARFVAETPDARDNTPQLLHDQPWGLPQEAGMQLLPGIHAGDGFYYAKLEKLIPEG